MAALDMYADRGQWDKCIETASKQVTCRKGPDCQNTTSVNEMAFRHLDIIDKIFHKNLFFYFCLIICDCNLCLLPPARTLRSSISTWLCTPHTSSRRRRLWGLCSSTSSTERPLTLRYGTHTFSSTAETCRCALINLSHSKEKRSSHFLFDSLHYLVNSFLGRISGHTPRGFLTKGSDKDGRHNSHSISFPSIRINTCNLSRTLILFLLLWSYCSLVPHYCHPQSQQTNNKNIKKHTRRHKRK